MSGESAQGKGAAGGKAGGATKGAAAGKAGGAGGSDSGEGVGTAAARRVASGATRLARAWSVLPPDRRLAAGAAIGLFLALFLPWYQETVIVPGKSANLQAASATLTGWGAFSFVEAALLLIAAGVLTLLFQRAEGRAFHLPGGDGTVITVAGVWTCLLVTWRIFDKQGTSNNGQLATTSGIEWGIFIALAVAVLLTYAGTRIRAAHRPEPPLPGERVAPATTKPPPASGSPANDPAPPRRRPASLSAPEAAPAPYPRAAARSAPQQRSEHPTLPQPDSHDTPTLRQRAPGSLWQAPSPPDERDTEPKAPPDEQMTIRLEQRDES